MYIRTQRVLAVGVSGGENDILLNFLNQEGINTDIKQNENSTIVMIEYNKTLIAKLVKELESKNFLFTILWYIITVFVRNQELWDGIQSSFCYWLYR